MHYTQPPRVELGVTLCMSLDRGVPLIRVTYIPILLAHFGIAKGSEMCEFPSPSIREGVK